MREVALFLWLASLSCALGSPLRCLDCLPEGKRDIFMSRGWGAGGMPFTLLHPNQWNSLNEMGEGLDEPSVEYLTASKPLEEPENIKQPTIPQLFVSYGWGPLGK